ncbi:MAG: hypothetical protein ACI853_001282, partial [Paracoccaceae bacterium]
PVPHNYNKRAENASIKADETPEGRADKRSQKDVDAHWTRKHGKSRYSHKNHPDVDLKHKLIRRYHVSPSRDIAWQCPAGQWMPPRRCCRAWQSGGGSIVDAVKHLFQGPGGCRLSVGRDRSGAKSQEADHPHSPPMASEASGASRCPGRPGRATAPNPHCGSGSSISLARRSMTWAAHLCESSASCGSGPRSRPRPRSGSG